MHISLEYGITVLRHFYLLPFFMPQWKEQDITKFQKLYFKHYGKKINRDEADIKITALVGLISLAIEVEKSQKDDPNGNVSELD